MFSYNLLIIIALSFIYPLFEAEIYKEIFKVRAGLYKSFFSVDYKFINIPRNLYDLNISFKFVRWVGFLPLCPVSVNISSVLQYGTFPLFMHDSKFQYNYHYGQKIEMFISKNDKQFNTKNFKLISPKDGVWIFGAIYDNNDDYIHPVLCLADLQVSFVGYIYTPSISVILIPSLTSMKIPIVLNKSEGGKLVEIISTNPLSNIRISHLCSDCIVKVLVGNNVIPQISLVMSKNIKKLLFQYNETIIVHRNYVELTTRYLLYIQTLYKVITKLNILVEYSSITTNKQVVMMAPASKMRGDTLFSYRFTLSDSLSSKMIITLIPNKIVLLPFYIEPIKDQGSILTIDMVIYNTRMKNYTLYVCIAGRGVTNVTDLMKSMTNSSICRQSVFPSTIETDKLQYKYYYPETHWWFITLMIQVPPEIIDANYSQWKVNVSVYSKSCRHDSESCNRKGYCLLTGVDTGLVSSCHCFKPYYGLDCNRMQKSLLRKFRDSTNRRNWLVLSNVAFLPAIIIAILQRLFTPLLIYFVTAGFSMIYHMCYMEDSDLAYCLFKVEELAYYDHLAAVVSIWITMITLSTLPYKLQMVLNIFMVFLCVILADIIQKSIWFYCIPLLIGSTILITCWIFRMHQLKCIFPPLDWWVFGLIPGLIIAGIGFVMFRLSIKQEYAYHLYHSIWHIFIALSICFVLPNTKRWTKALNQTHPEGSNFRYFYNLLTINNQKWYKFKKDLNYYLHLDVLLNPLLERNSKWSICKSY